MNLKASKPLGLVRRAKRTAHGMTPLNEMSGAGLEGLLGCVWMRGLSALTDEGCEVSSLGDENVLDPDGDDGCETGRVQKHELHTSKC